MQSTIRMYMDIGHPHWVTRPGLELYGIFLSTVRLEPGIESDSLTPMSAPWSGMVYSYYQWFYGCSSTELVTMLPPHKMSQIYRPWHEVEITRIAEKLGYPVKI